MGASSANFSYDTSGNYAWAVASNELQAWTAGTKRMVIDASGNVEIRSAATLGYGSGAGGTVTQATSKSTSVTLAKPCGTITMHNAALGAGATVTFQVNNNLVSQTDCIVVNSVDDFGAAYVATASEVWDGYFYIRVTNNTAGSRSEAVRINFTVLNSSRT